MKKTQLISSLIIGSIIALSGITTGEQIATAKKPKPVSLLRAKCVSSGLGSARRQKLNISIGRAVYSSKFYLGAGNRSAAITCKIKPQKSTNNIFKTLNLDFGMRDNDTNSPGVEVKIYLDGQAVENRLVNPTQKASVSLDVSNTSNVAIEANCVSQVRYCNRVYFFTSNLEK